MQNKSEQDDDLFERESSNKSKIWLAVLIIIILAGVAVGFWFAKGGGFWFLQDKEDNNILGRDNFSNAYDSMKEKITKEVESIENTINSNQPFQTEGKEQEVRNQIEDTGVSERGAISNQWKSSVNTGHTDDTFVQITFIDDLAERLVKEYTPSKIKGHPGIIALGLQDVNLFYGGKLIGFKWSGDNFQKGRSEILKYVFTPTMLDALYLLYIDRFMDTVGGKLSIGKKDRALTVKEKQEFYRLYASQFKGISGALQGIATMPNFMKQMDEAKIASQKVVDKSNSYTNTIEQIDMYSMAKSTQSQLTLKVELAAQEYQQAVIHREEVLNRIVNLIKKNMAARIIDDSNILYLAYWIERRVKNNPQNMAAVTQAATIFLDLSKRFEEKSKTIAY